MGNNYADYYSKINLFSSAKGLIFDQKRADTAETFAKAEGYENILIGLEKVKAEDNAAFHKALVSLLSTNKKTLKDELAKDENIRQKLEDMVAFLKNSHPVAEFHTEVYDKFLFDDAFIEAFVKIAISKIFLSLEDLEQWEDSIFFKRMTKMKLYNLPTPDDLESALRARRQDIADIYANITRNGKRTVEYACQFLELFTITPLNGFAQEKVFSEDYHNLRSKRSPLTKDEWVKFALQEMKKHSKIEEDIPTAMRIIPTKINRWKLREAILSKNFVTPQSKELFEGVLDFNPDTWLNFDSIVELLKKIPIHGECDEISLLNAVLDWASNLKTQEFDVSDA